jgi:hypothetical protein
MEHLFSNKRTCTKEFRSSTRYDPNIIVQTSLDDSLLLQ